MTSSTDNIKINMKKWKSTSLATIVKLIKQLISITGEHDTHLHGINNAVEFKM